jgi:hypothetical protein
VAAGFPGPDFRIEICKREIMAEKSRIRRVGEQVREKVNQLRSASASVKDRVVSNPEPEEQQPQPVKKKPIVSVNGEDVAA